MSIENYKKYKEFVEKRETSEKFVSSVILKGVEIQSLKLRSLEEQRDRSGYNNRIDCPDHFIYYISESFKDHLDSILTLALIKMYDSEEKLLENSTNDIKSISDDLEITNKSLERS